MTNAEIARWRLQNQHIANPVFKKPEDIVAYMGAIQAQDYAAAKWALGLRLQNSSDAKIDKALAMGSIIRTHVLRPTWHFMVPADARWMIDLSALRIKAAAAAQYRQFNLDGTVFSKANDVLAKTLAGKQVARPEVAAILNRAGIATNEQRFIHILMNAELDKVICSGGRQGKQFSYALFDDRVPAASPLAHDEALARLARRYFISRGPATLHDFAWWGGITLADAKTGFEAIKEELSLVKSDGREFWMNKELPHSATRSPQAHLLPAFDEFTVAYAGRDAAVHAKYLPRDPFVLLGPAIVVNDQIAGSWKRELVRGETCINLIPFGNLNKTQISSLERAKKKYQKFVS